MLEGKSLGRKQTLTYLKGYQHEGADLGSRMSAEGAAKGTGTHVPANYGSPKTGTLIGTAGSYGSPKAGTATQRGSGSPLPKWVEENGLVSRKSLGFRNEQGVACTACLQCPYTCVMAQHQHRVLLAAWLSKVSEWGPHLAPT